MKTIGILGGTFDPIHFGHLRIAQELADNLSITTVHLIPCYQSPLRNQTQATASQRFVMTELAIAGNPLFVADPREITREGQSFTIDTLIELRQEYTDTALCLFLGYDAFLGLPTWKRYNEILDFAHIIVARRPHFAPPTHGPLYDIMKMRNQDKVESIHSHIAGGVFFVSTTELDISATAIRKQIAMQRNPRYLLPEDVHHYIQLNGIYET